MDNGQTNRGEIASLMERILYEVKKVIVGQDHFLERVLVAVLARGHLLVEGVPGLAKTLTVKTLARTIHGSFKRIQFTPDLVPADLVGTRIYNQKSGDFMTSLGPVFANLLLADEINRAPAKVQSALLEVMQEHQVTIAGESHRVPEPFLVMATQNPIEQEGTYPLPEAQLDRFMFNIKVGYPSSEEEERILAVTTRNERVDVNKVLSARAIVNVQKLVSSVAVSEYIVKYVARLVRATRPKDESAPQYVRELVDWGAGPRAGQFLINGGKALAAMEGRFSVAIEDVRKIAIPVLRHRISTNFQAQAEGLTTEDIIQRLVREVPEPDVPKYAGNTPPAPPPRS
jgi:MoxR-like ATPase